MSKTPPVIQSSVNDAHTKGSVFLPVNVDESKALVSLRPSFVSSFPSAFDDPRYDLPLDSIHTRFASIVAPAPGLQPKSYYPKALAEVCPPFNGDQAVTSYAEGIDLYLAMRCLEDVVGPTIHLETTGEVEAVSIPDMQQYKDCLDKSGPALVRFSFTLYIALYSYVYFPP